jgi:hypothetical protein
VLAVEAGRFLAKIEHGMQWAIGDWYNGIRDEYGEKKAACERAGLNYKTARAYGNVASKYEVSRRLDTLRFDHHQVVEALGAPQRPSSHC